MSINIHQTFVSLMETNLKVDGATHQQVWRHTYGQPRGFDARFVLQILNIVPKLLFAQIPMVFPNLLSSGTSTTSAMGLPWTPRATISSSEGELLFSSPFVWQIRLKAKVKNNWMKLVLGPNFASSTLFHTLVSGLGMSTIMRRRTLMGGAATPG